MPALNISIDTVSHLSTGGCARRSLMLHGLLALAAAGQQVLLRTHRAWMPSDAKARPYDAAVSKFHSIAFIFFAMPSVLVPLSLLLEFLKVCATYRSCRLSTWSDGY